MQQIKQDFPGLEIIINGGITSLEHSTELRLNVDGVMLGREVYHNPYILAEVDSRIYHPPGVGADERVVLQALELVQS